MLLLNEMMEPTRTRTLTRNQFYALTVTHRSMGKKAIYNQTRFRSTDAQEGVGRRTPRPARCLVTQAERHLAGRADANTLLGGSAQPTSAAAL